MKLGAPDKSGKRRRSRIKIADQPVETSDIYRRERMEKE